MSEEVFDRKLCLFPVQQAGAGRAHWVQVADETGKSGELTLINPGVQSSFSGGYVFIPHSERIGMMKNMPGMRMEVYINENSCKAKEKQTVILFAKEDLKQFNDAVREYENSAFSNSSESLRCLMERMNRKELFDLIIYNTMLLLYSENSFQYWRILVKQGCVPYLIREHQWNGWKQYRGGILSCDLQDGYIDTPPRYYFYGTETAKEENGIREVGRYLRKMTGGIMNEAMAKDFLCSVNPLECGRYVCGIKASDLSTANCYGYGYGKESKLLYDKEAIYRGMVEAAANKGGQRYV